MKKLCLFVVILFFTGTLLSQGIGEVEFVNKIGEKKIVTAGDVVKFFVLTVQGNSRGFKKDLKTLKNKNIATGYNFSAKDIIRKGELSRMTARYLKLNHSLMYKIFKSERYAFRECVAAGIMISDGSEWDKISGEELIEIMSKIGDKIEVKSGKK